MLHFQHVSALFQSFGSFKTNRLLCTSCFTFDPTLIPSFIFHCHSSFPLCSSPCCLNAEAHSTMSLCLSCIDLFLLIASHKTLRILFSQLLSRLSQGSKWFRWVLSARHVGKTLRDKEQRAKLNIIFNHWTQKGDIRLHIRFHFHEQTLNKSATNMKVEKQNKDL